MARYDGSIRINTRINTDGIRRGEADIRGSMGRISSSAKKLYGALAAVFAVGKIAQFGKEALQAASDFEAMEAQFSQVFGNLEKDASQSLSAIANQAGIVEERMKASYTKIAAFAKTTGMDTASSMELANRAMVAVADSAAFYDRSLEETTESLQSFLKGNYENDAALGLSATEFTRNAAANKLYGKSFIDLTEAQKQLTLLQMVEDANRLSGAMGQAAREADTWTNQIGNLKQSWTTLMASIGKIILPVAIQAVKFITNVINSLNAMIAKLSVAAGAFRSFSELLTGNKSSAGSGAGNVTSSGGISENTADGYNAAADAAENLAGSTEKAAKATKDAKKAAEGYLNPLDEINKINEKNNDSSPGSGGGGAAPGIGGAVENVDYGSLAEGETVVDKLDEKLLALKEILSGLIRPFKEAWDLEGAATIEAARFAFSSLGELAKSVAKSFYEVWTNGTGTQTLTLILQIAQNVLMTIGNIADRLNVAWNTNSVGTSIIQNIFDIYNTILGTIERITGATAEWAGKLDFYPLLESINGLLESVQPLTQNIGDGLAWFYENVLLPIAGWTIQEAVPAFLDMLSAAIRTVNEVIEALKPYWKWWYESILIPLGQWTGDVIIAAMETITGLLTKFSSWISENQSLVEGFVIVIVSFFAAWDIVNLATTIAGIVTALTSFIATGGLAATVAGVLGAAIGFLTSPITIAVAIIGSLIAIGVLLWKNWDTIKEKAGELKDWLLEKWESIKSGIGSVIDGIVEAAKGLIPGIIQGIKDGWDSFINWLGDLWNGIVESFKDFFGIHSPSTLMAEMGGYLMEGLLGGIKGLAGNVKQAWDSMKQTAVQTWETVKQNIGSKWDQIKTNSKTTFSTIASNIRTSWDSIKTNVKNAADTAKNNIVTAWKTAGDNTRTSWENMKTNAVTAAKSIASNAKAKYSEIKDAVRSFSSSAPSLWRSAWNNMDDKVASVLNSIKRAVSNVFSWISNSIKNLGNSLKNLSSNASSVGRSGTSYTRLANARTAYSAPSPYSLCPAMESIDTSKIPGYATGQVIPARMKQHLAWLGDNNRETEVVSPLSTIKQANKESLLEVLSELGFTGNRGIGNTQTIIIKQYLDGKQVAQSVIKEGKIQQMATGSNMFMLGST